MRLSDKRVLITGGTAGIGRALARTLSERGARVMICGRDAARLDAALETLPGVEGTVCDISRGPALEALADETLARLGGLDLLVNNAGIQQALAFASIPVDAAAQLGDAVEREILVNLVAPLRLTALCLDALRRGDEPAVVNVTSILAQSPKAGAPAYCASKAALHSATLSLRHQLAATGVRVVEVVPPLVDTAMTHGNEALDKVSPETVANAIAVGLLQNRDEIRVGRARLAGWLLRVAPGLLSRKLLTS